MHRASDFKVARESRGCYSINWKDFEIDVKTVEEWMKSQPVATWKATYEDTGYLAVENLLTEDEVKIYANIYDKMLAGDIDVSDHRHDLGNHDSPKTKEENICQIMWPSVYVTQLEQGPLHERARAVGQYIIGDDVAMDFDFLIYKAPHTNTETPWHQDESYWPDLQDKRAASCWVALDDATVENGCMWFVPGSHKQGLRKHQPAKQGCHVLTCHYNDNEGKPVPLKRGSCTFHSGRTMHHTEGNSTDTKRRAYVVNFRPATMVDQSRNLGFDHGMKDGVNNVLLRNQETESHKN